jgi:hypothetical protein
MIKVTYQIICNICKTECLTQIFECSNYLGLPFPPPSQLHTYSFKEPIELCNECAAPLIKAKREIVDKYINS